MVKKHIMNNNVITNQIHMGKKKTHTLFNLTSFSASVMDDVLSCGSMAEITGNAE